MGLSDQYVHRARRSIRSAGGRGVARAHATRIQDPFGAGPRDALYELPWENPAIQFELNAELTTIPAVDYAEPNFLYRICPLTPGMTQSH